MNTANQGFTQPSFDDFVLEVLDDRRGRASRRVSKRHEYPVRIRTPVGDLQATMRLPWDQEELNNRLLRVENAILWSGGQKRRQIAGDRVREVQSFGTALFDAVFSDEAGGLYYQSHADSERNRKGLRLKLRIEPPELASLPWEFLFDSRSASFICLSTLTPIVRDLGLPVPAEPLAVDGPLRILGMVASPSGMDALDEPHERERVEKALAGPIAARSVVLRWLEGSAWWDLKREIRRGQFHVFHFIGHGGFDASADEGLIALSNDDGSPYYLRATDLAMLLADEEALRLVVLNSCDGARGGTQDVFSSTASILVRRAIPAVLAMQYEITDEAAIGFSRAFYEALADGMPIDAAVADGRQAVRLANPGSLEWATPVLYQRAPDGALFNLENARRQPRHKPPGSPQLEEPPERTQGATGEHGPGGEARVGVSIPIERPVDEPTEIVDTRDAPGEPAAPAAGNGILAPGDLDARAGGDGMPPELPGAVPPSGRAYLSGSEGRPKGDGARARVSTSITPWMLSSATTRTLVLLALASALFVGLVFDPVPWVIAAAGSGVLISIGSAFGRRAADRADAPVGARWSTRALRPAALTCASIGVAAILLVAAGIPGLSDVATEIDSWSSPWQIGVVLSGIGAIALGAFIGGLRRPQWAGARSGGGSIGTVFLAALIAFLLFGGASPTPVVTACNTAGATAVTATGHSGAVGSSPVMFRGTAARTGHVSMATNASPDVQVLASTGGQIWSSPTVAYGQVFVGSNDGCVYGTDLATGRQLPGWPFNTGDYVYSSPTIEDGVVYFGSSAAKDGDVGRVHAIEIATGRELEGWPVETNGGQVFASPIVRGGKVYVGGTDGTFYIIDAKAGSSGHIDTIDLGSPIWSTAAVAGEVAFVGVEANAVIALDLTNLTIRWTVATSGAVISSPAIVDDTIYVGSYDDFVYAIDAESGTERWRFRTGGDVDSSPAVGNGVVFVCSKDQNLYALDASTGKELWSYRTGGVLWSSPALDIGTVYFGSDDGRLYALDIGPRGARLGEWHVAIVRRAPRLSGPHQTAKMRSSALVVGDAVVIGSVDGNLYLVTVDPHDSSPVASPAATPEPGATPVP